MRLRLLHCWLREGKREGGAFVPCTPLVHVVGAEEISSLACDRVQGGLVEVGKIGGVAFGGTEGAAYLLDGEPASGLIVQAGPAPAANERQAAEHGMFDVDGRELAPSPLREFLGCFRIADRGLHGCGEQRL